MPASNKPAFNSSRKLGAAFALAATLALPQIASAILVTPGQTVTLSGTTAAQRPETGGVVLADVERTFSIPDGHKGFVAGFLQDRVVRSGVTGTLIFYQRIVLNSNSSTVTSLDAFVRSNFTAVSTDADYRTDGLGDLGSTSASCNTAGASIQFNLAREVAPGESTYFHMILTNATNYAATGKTILMGPGLASKSLATFQPAGTPQPYYTATLFSNFYEMALNDRGQVSMVDYSTYQPDLWNPSVPNSTDGTVYSLPVPTGFVGAALSHINSNGWIAGTAYTQTPPDPNSRAFVWKPTKSNGTTYTTTNLGVYPGGTFSIGMGINTAGEVVGGGDIGYANDGGSSLLWSGGKVTLVGDTDYGDAYAINKSGQIAGYGDFGYGTYQGFVFTPSTSNGSTGTIAHVYDDGGSNYTGSGVTFALNDSGVSVGYAEYDPGTGFAVQGYLWDGETVTDLGPNMSPLAINNAGTVVGSDDDASGFLYRNKAMTSLTYFITPGVFLYSASGINTIEQIVGSAYVSGNGVSVLLTPVRISNVSPASVMHGSSGVTVTIKGLGFLYGADLLWNATPLSVSRVNSNDLTVSVPASLLSSPGVARLQVINPDGTYSSVGSFSVK